MGHATEQATLATLERIEKLLERPAVSEAAELQAAPDHSEEILTELKGLRADLAKFCERLCDKAASDQPSAVSQPQPPAQQQSTTTDAQPSKVES